MKLVSPLSRVFKLTFAVMLLGLVLVSAASAGSVALHPETGEVYRIESGRIIVDANGLEVTVAGGGNLPLQQQQLPVRATQAIIDPESIEFTQNGDLVFAQGEEIYKIESGLITIRYVSN